MSITFTNNLQVPSELTALPNRFTRPGFGSLYGFDATPTEAPVVTISSAVTIDATSTGWNLTWPAVSGATGYRWSQSSSASVDPSTIGSVVATPLNLGVAAGNLTSSNYIYIRAENSAGLSPWSNAIPVRAVGQTTLTVGTPTGATLPLTWSLLGVGSDTAYELQYAEDSGFTTGTGSANIAGGTTSYNFTMTTPGTTYYFKIRGKGTSSGPPSTDAYGIYSTTVSHLYPASGFTISILDTEANILARSSDADGTVAYGTDTECFYVFNGVSWFKYPEQQ